MAQDARTMTANSSDPFLNRLVSLKKKEKRKSQVCPVGRKWRKCSSDALIDVTWRKELPFWFSLSDLMYPV